MRILHLATTVSTMADAAALANKGEPSGTIVVADRQTAGIGRHGHSWQSDDFGGLYFSVILRLAVPVDHLPVLTMALGLAVQSVVNEYAQIAADLRWPNDVLVSEKKLAGILVQSAGDALIAGIGVNVNQKVFPAELQPIATSLQMETGQQYSKADLLDRLRPAMLQYSSILADRGRHEVFRLFTHRSSYVEGKRVEVDSNGKLVRGVTAGLDENGFLLLETAQGKVTVIAGGVRPI